MVGVEEQMMRLEMGEVGRGQQNTYVAGVARGTKTSP